jgi:carbonic anhydrase
MACTGNLAPINLTDIKSDIQKCEVTCNYQFSYGASSCKVTPNGNFLSYKYDGITVVTYNATEAGSKYNVEEIRIYSPPLNNYTNNENDAIAELFIHHTSEATGKNLLVCVPLSLNDASSKSSELLEQIISSSIEKDGGEQSINVQNFTLDNLIPITDYYQYNGDIPYSQTGNNICSSQNANIIIFPANGFINMNTNTKNTLKSLIIPTNKQSLQNPSNVGLRHNKNGTINNTSSGNDIYIECNALDDDGNIVEHDGTNIESNLESTQQKGMSDATKTRIISIIFTILGILIGLAIIYFAGHYIWKYMQALKNDGGSTSVSS